MGTLATQFEKQARLVEGIEFYLDLNLLILFDHIQNNLVYTSIKESEVTFSYVLIKVTGSILIKLIKKSVPKPKDLHQNPFINVTIIGQGSIKFNPK